MRHILQKGDMDCGIACVAMLAGVGYFEALEAFNDKESAVEKGNLAPALRDALINLWHQPAKRVTKFRGYDVLENDAILKVNPYNKGRIGIGSRGARKGRESIIALSQF
jgi:hypothetical protein